MSTLPLSGVNSLFLTPSRFSLKIYRLFFAYFELEKMHSMHSAQHQVELRRLGNQLPVLGKANSLCKIVKCCVFCLFVKLRLSLGPRRAPDKDIRDCSSGKICVASRRCTIIPIAPPGGGWGNTNSRFLSFFVCSIPLFRSLMLTPMITICH